MALSTNKIASWADIKAIFTSLNQARAKYNYSSISVPEYTGDPMKQNVITTLNSGLTDMRNNSKLSSYISTITIPDVGDLIKPLSFTQLQSSINAVYTCTGYHATNVSGHNGTNFGNCFTCSNNFGSNHSGHNATNHSGHNGSNHSGHNASNNGWSGFSNYFTGEYYSYKTGYGCSSVNSGV